MFNLRFWCAEYVYSAHSLLFSRLWEDCVFALVGLNSFKPIDRVCCFELSLSSPLKMSTAFMAWSNSLNSSSNLSDREKVGVKSSITISETDGGSVGGVAAAPPAGMCFVNRVPWFGFVGWFLHCCSFLLPSAIPAVLRFGTSTQGRP